MANHLSMTFSWKGSLQLWLLTLRLALYQLRCLIFQLSNLFCLLHYFEAICVSSLTFVFSHKITFTSRCSVMMLQTNRNPSCRAQLIYILNCISLAMFRSECLIMILLLPVTIILIESCAHKQAKIVRLSGICHNRKLLLTVMEAWGGLAR